jgi:hypothetical protein
MAFRSTHTRPTKTTLYEFDFSTKKLTIINQLLDSELRLGNVYSRIEAYPVIKGWDYAKLSADFYSIFIHKYLFSQYGDYVFMLDNIFDTALIVHKDGTFEYSERTRNSKNFDNTLQ